MSYTAMYRVTVLYLDKANYIVVIPCTQIPTFQAMDQYTSFSIKLKNSELPDLILKIFQYSSYWPLLEGI